MKKVIFILITALLLTAARATVAAPMRYTFTGLVTDFQSYHQDYDITDFDIVLGETTVNYVFVVDFDSAISSFTNSAGTWNYFYSDLIEGSIINGGNIYGDYYGYNWYQLAGPNMGQITSNLADVRINTSEAFTQNWRVEDWQIGQSFRSIDLACYPGGGTAGCAVYAYGNVTLTSITAVPLPGALILFLSGILGLKLANRKT